MVTDETTFPDSPEKVFVSACHEAWRRRMAQIGDKARRENSNFTKQVQREFIRLRPTVNQYMRKKVPGFIKSIRFKNVTIEGKPGEYLVQIQGADLEHDVQDVTFENVSILGEKLTRESNRVKLGENAKDIRFIPQP